MADHESVPATEKPASNPSPSPLTDRLRAAVAEAAEKAKEVISGGHDVAEGNPVAPSHVPGKPEEGEGSNTQGRGKSPGQPTPSFMERLTELRHALSEVEDFGYCPNEIEPDDR